MGINWCKHCWGGSGQIRDPNRKWWEVWKTIPCPACGGDGYAKPPGWPDADKMQRLRPPPPPSVLQASPAVASIITRLDEDMEPLRVVFSVREGVQIERIARLVNEPVEKVVHDAVTEWMLPKLREMLSEETERRQLRTAAKEQKPSA